MDRYIDHLIIGLSNFNQKKTYNSHCNGYLPLMLLYAFVNWF